MHLTTNLVQGACMTSNNRKEHDALLSELTAILSKKTEEAVSARNSLRDAVCAYVGLEHSRGTPLATVIETVKGILTTAEGDGARASGELAVQLIDWCVEFHRPKNPAKPVLFN